MPTLIRTDLGAARHRRGTTLIETLVVMVIFLVGILAVVQIFPKGFQILLLSRSSSVATALSRDEVQRLKARPDQLPEAIVALASDGSIDINRSPFDLGPLGNGILGDGTLTMNGVNVGPWGRYSGANGVRHVIGEGQRVPAPRRVGAAGDPRFYGGLMVLQFGPVDFARPGGGYRVYGNDLNVTRGAWDGRSVRDDFDAFLAQSGSGVQLAVPTGPLPRQYRVSFSVYVQQGSRYVLREFPGLVWSLPDAPFPGANSPYPLAEIALYDLLQQNYPDGRYSGIVFGAVDPNSVRVQRLYQQIASNAAWSPDDLYQVKILDPRLGVLLFHPGAASVTVPRGSGSENLMARVDYDVLDWRILRDEFRFAYNLPAQHRLAVGSLKVSRVTGPDGRLSAGIPLLEDADGPAEIQAISHDRADHILLMDLDTGGIYLEQPEGDATNSANPIVRVDKSLGVVTMRDTDDDASNGTTVHLRLPDGTVVTDLAVDGRAIRALYMANDEYAVQVLKTPSLYQATSARPELGQFYIGGSGAIGGGTTRVYFPASDAGRKVIAGEISYRRTGDLAPRLLMSQDFVIQPANLADPVALPFIDIRTADPDAAQIDVAIDARSNGIGVRDVRGASIAVRTVWNPDSFNLDGSPEQNLLSFERFLRGFRRSTIETYLEQGGRLQ